MYKLGRGNHTKRVWRLHMENQFGKELLRWSIILITPLNAGKFTATAIGKGYCEREGYTFISVHNLGPANEVTGNEMPGKP